MKVLLDTHAWLFSILTPERLSATATTSMQQEDVTCHISAVSAWEILLLAERGRIDIGINPAQWVRRAAARSDVRVLPLDLETALLSRNLPDYPGQDPTDRFLVATCVQHGLTMITADSQIRSWGGIRTIW